MGIKEKISNGIDMEKLNDTVTAIKNQPDLAS